MYDGHDSPNPFPHNGESDRECTGYGCDCDEERYGSYHKKTGKYSNGKGTKVLIIFAIAIFLECVNPLIGAIVLIAGFIYAFSNN